MGCFRKIFSILLLLLCATSAQAQWRVIDALEQGRWYGSLTLLPTGEVLAAGGVPTRFSTTGMDHCELLDLKTLTWQTIQPMGSARYDHTATLLPTGEALLAGGRTEASNILNDVELFDPSSRSWRPGAPMIQARAQHTATRLESGKILVLGGIDAAGQPLSSAEIYDPASGQWSPGAAMNRPRSKHTATRLESGQILVIEYEADLSNGSIAEIYDPTTDSWEPIDDPLQPHSEHTATLMPTGEVVVYNGHWYGVESFIPDVGWIERLGYRVAPVCRDAHSIVLMPNGLLMVTGCRNSPNVHSTRFELPDRAERRGDLSRYYGVANSLVLPSGEVLLAGGSTAPQWVELFTPEPREDPIWDAVNSPARPRSSATVTELSDGRVLWLGGFDGTDSVATAEIYDPTLAPTWQAVTSMSDPRERHTTTLLTDGRVLVVGGRSQTHGTEPASRDSAEIYDPVIDVWSPASPMADARHRHTATLLTNGQVLVAGGRRAVGGGGDAYFAEVELYDPGADSWSDVAPMTTKRYGHSATRLLDGRVLVVGGADETTTHTSAEIYDPRTDSWSATEGPPSKARFRPIAVPLLDGRILVVGGDSSRTPEVFDPATGTFNNTPVYAQAIQVQSASRLASGHVVIVGRHSNGTMRVYQYDPPRNNWKTLEVPSGVYGDTELARLPDRKLLLVGDRSTQFGTGELYRPGVIPAWTGPVITDAPEVLELGTSFTVTGENFGGQFPASSSSTRNAAVDHPLLRLEHTETGRRHWLPYDPVDSFSADPMTLDVSSLPADLEQGVYRLTVHTSGQTSEARFVRVDCDLTLEAPLDDRLVAVGETVTFSAQSTQALTYRWQRDRIDIPGATSADYTLPAVTLADSGARFRVIVGNDCGTVTSNEAILRVDDTAPSVVVDDPNGGELWTLSDSAEVRSETVRWNMVDDNLVCRARLRLLVSTDDGATFEPVPDDDGDPSNDGLLADLGSDDCTAPGLLGRSFEVEMPVDPPVDDPTAQYLVEIEVSDGVGLQAIDPSDAPFSIVPQGTAKTLILVHLDRMAAIHSLDATGRQSLEGALADLATHSAVQGRVIDLGATPTINTLYDDWDLSGDPLDANEVLFGEGGIHEQIQNLIQGPFPEIEYLVLVGDDRLLPLARIEDSTAWLTESDYPEGTELTGTSTVGRALAANLYLSDDPLSVIDEFDPSGLDDSLFLSDLLTGRLVETPREIETAIATFLARDGKVDLRELDPTTGHQVQVTGYDFLIDSAKQIRRRWRQALDLEPYDPDTDLAPLDGQLIGRDWDLATNDDRHDALAEHLAGLPNDPDFAGGPYSLINFNGHATHFEAGVPGFSFTDITGLSTHRLANLDFTGALIFAVGCHSGLPVPGSDPSDADNSLDLPQVFLGGGALAYAANTGYGWGLLHGIGYGERLVSVFNQELILGGAETVGGLVRRAKRRYYQEQARVDAFDLKTQMQWTLYGFPMLRVETGLGGDSSQTSPAGVFEGPAPTLDSLPTTETLAGARVRRRVISEGETEGGATTPDHLTRIAGTFYFDAGGLFTKLDASGEVVADGFVGCPEPAEGEAEGCYYQYHDLATAETDLPIQPFTVFDSRLAGTSLHGVLWKGGRYEEETDWTPIFARLASNIDDADYDAGAAPRSIINRPRGLRDDPGEDPLVCRPTDLETSSVVMVLGELLTADDGARQRLLREMAIERLYFNNTVDPQENCDRQGPELGDGPYTELVGDFVRWQVAPPQLDDVWRVVVVYDTGASTDGTGEWRPLELTDDGTGVWRGEVGPILGGSLSYVLQAVDFRGNVSWLEFVEEPGELPESGVPLGIPEVVRVDVDPVQYDLAVAGDGSSGSVVGGRPVIYTLVVENLGPTSVSDVMVSITLPAGSELVGGTGVGWTCDDGSPELSCHRLGLGAGLVAPELKVTLIAPETPGTITLDAVVEALGEETDASNNHVTIATEVLSGADLTVRKTDHGAIALPGEPLVYTIAATNRGPLPVLGARVTDFFPPEIENVTWTCLATPGSVCTASGSGNIDELVDLEDGGAVIFVATGTVADGISGTIENTAGILPPAETDDPDPGNNASSVETAIADPSTLVFRDGFETGDVSAWSAAVGEAGAVPAKSKNESDKD